MNLLLQTLLVFLAVGSPARDYYAEADNLYADGKYSEALSLALEGLSEPELSDSAAVELWSVIGSSYARLGSFDRAAEYLKKCYEYDKLVGGPEGLTSSLVTLSSIYVLAEEPEQGEKYVLEAIENELTVGRPDKLSMAYGKACDVYHAMDNDSLALKYANYAVKIAQDQLNDHYVAIRRSQRAYPLTGLGRFDEAMEDMKYAEEVFRREDSPQSLTIVCFQLGQEYGRRGLTGLERKYYEEAADIARNIGDKALLLKICTSMSESLHYEDPLRAFGWLQEASAIQDTLAHEKSRSALEVFNVEYETEKREATIANQKEEIHREHRQRRFLVSSIVILLLATALTVFYAIRFRLNASKLERLNSQKDFLFKVISHDIHSPAVARLRGIQMIRGKSGTTPEQYDAVLRQLERQSETEVELINNVLRWTESKSGGKKGETLDVLVPDIVSEVVGQYKSVAAMKNITLTGDCPSGATVHFNRTNLVLALRNLVSNAIKFSPAGSEVLVRASSVPDGAEIRVIDHGIGIPEENVRDLFKFNSPYKRSGTEGEAGNGLGLAVSQTLINEFGGTLSLEKSSPEGSVFLIRIVNG